MWKTSIRKGDSRNTKKYQSEVQETEARHAGKCRRAPGEARGLGMLGSAGEFLVRPGARHAGKYR